MLLKRPEDAISDFDEAINESKGEKWVWTAWFSKGIALKSLGKYTDADNAFDRAREIRLGGDPWKLLLHNLKEMSGL
jgi:tetratricopeptide (TPR) repeat protein